MVEKVGTQAQEGDKIMRIIMGGLKVISQKGSEVHRQKGLEKKTMTDEEGGIKASEIEKDDKVYAPLTYLHGYDIILNCHIQG